MASRSQGTAASASGASNAAKSSSQTPLKRQREEKLRQYGIDLPDIPGLPLQIIPLHVHAAKVTAKLFSKSDYQHKVLHPGEVPKEESRGEDNGTDTANRTSEESSVLDSILQRVDESQAQASVSNDERVRLRELYQRQQDGVQAWLHAIHRCVRDDRSRRPPPPNADSNESSSAVAEVPSKVSVPVAALRHLWEEGQDHARIAVRRATLNLSGKLLEKSAECRQWWLGSKQEGSKSLIVEWMDSLLEQPTSASSPNVAAGLRLLQQESFLLLTHLESKGYGDFYETLPVAVQRFQQKCPAVSSWSTTTTNTTLYRMADWRQIRDIAMEHCEETQRRLSKLFRRAQSCMDVLVPRVHSPDRDAQMNSGIDDRDNEDEEEEEEEEDINWEDGWEEEDENCSTILNDDNATTTHAAAVERTLEAMQSVGGLREGGLEISFAQSVQATETTDPSRDAAVVEARVRLDKIVKILMERYMPLLSLWVEALTNADALIDSRCNVASGVSSLVSMSSEMLGRRNQVVKKCVDMKNEVARILSSAKRLGMDSTSVALETTNQTREQASHVTRPVVADFVGARQNESLAANLSRKRYLDNKTRGRSNRIKIRFAKR